MSVKPEFEKEDRGYTIRGWYKTKDSDGKGVIELSSDGQLVKRFFCPSYKIWNFAAHLSDIVDGELSKTDKERGYRIAASPGLGPGTVIFLPRREKGGEENVLLGDVNKL